MHTHTSHSATHTPFSPNLLSIIIAPSYMPAQGLELVRGRPVFYSLGNFIFQTQKQNHVEAFTRAAWEGITVRIMKCPTPATPASAVPTSAAGATATGSKAHASAAAATDTSARGSSCSPTTLRLEIRPIVLQTDKGLGSAYGTPVLPGAEQGRSILRRFCELSASLGTKMRKKPSARRSGAAAICCTTFQS